jgi:hypothetical protein
MWDALPRDILISIFSGCEVKEICAWRRGTLKPSFDPSLVCKKWREIGTNENLWNALFLRDSNAFLWDISPNRDKSWFDKEPSSLERYRTYYYAMEIEYLKLIRETIPRPTKSQIKGTFKEFEIHKYQISLTMLPMLTG